MYYLYYLLTIIILMVIQFFLNFFKILFFVYKFYIKKFIIVYNFMIDFKSIKICILISKSSISANYIIVMWRIN